VPLQPYARIEWWPGGEVNVDARPLGERDVALMRMGRPVDPRRNVRCRSSGDGVLAVRAKLGDEHPAVGSTIFLRDRVF